ncbi:MAG: MFS transporter [Acidobacteriota bacterium]|nr:MFS transporter [Acidobacteriota bacterium]
MLQQDAVGSRGIERVRARVSLLLLLGVSLGSTGLIISMTVTALVAESIMGDPIWSGVPVAALVLGTAVGTSLLSVAMTRWGRRRGLILFYAIAAAGGLVACAATVVASLPFLISSVFVVGVGNSANALTRYVAADLSTLERRAAAVGWIVWSGTVGAMVGPNLLAPSDRVGVALGLPQLAGAYVVSALVFASAAVLYLVFLRPDPSVLSVYTESETVASGVVTRKRIGLFRPPHVQMSIVALVFGHAVMVLIMTMTPLHLRSAGHGLDVIGLVASSHIVGMFLLAPLTGYLVDRLGALPIIFAGQAVLLLSALGGIAVPASRPIWTGAILFALGLGWNLGFVAGSANLTRDVALGDRDWLQGRADSIVWVSAAVASLASSVLFSTVGFVGLGAIGAAVILVSSSTIAVRRWILSQPAS